MPETICCNYPTQSLTYSTTYTTATSCHYRHRNYDRNHRSADIRPPSKSRATKWRDCIFLAAFFFYFLLFLFSITTRARPDRPFDRDIVLESAGIILTYIFPDSASGGAMVDAGRHGQRYSLGEGNF